MHLYKHYNVISNYSTHYSYQLKKLVISNQNIINNQLRKVYNQLLNYNILIQQYCFDNLTCKFSINIIEILALRSNNIQFMSNIQFYQMLKSIMNYKFSINNLITLQNNMGQKDNKYYLLGQFNIQICISCIHNFTVY